MAAVAILAILASCSLSPTESHEASLPGAGDHARIAPRYNVLLIETDDMRADEIRWMPRTADVLAGSGIRFENAFAPNPLCCPSRTSVLTGQYSHNHQVLSHEGPYGFGSFDDRDTLATRLQTSGYRTALIGKYLNGYGVQATHREREDSLRYVPPGWTRWLAGSDHVWKAGQKFSGGTYNYFNLTANANGILRTWPGQYSTDVLTDLAQETVREFEKSRDPWFVWASYVAPHHGGPQEPDDPGVVPRSDGFRVAWVTPARPEWVKGMFDAQITHGAGIPPFGTSEADRSDKPTYLRTLPEFTDAERDALTAVTRQRAEALEVLDRDVSTMLTTLRKDGSLDHTVVVLTSDNGYYLGEHGKRQGKINLHEPSVRVPFLVAGPGVPHGVRYDPVTTMDLAATVAAWAGVVLTLPDGVDLTPTIRRGDLGWRHPVVLEGLMPEREYQAALASPEWTERLNTVGIRLGRWKYVRYATGEYELYDLLRDPLELSSINDKPGLRQKLDQVWHSAVHCKAEACRADLPPGLQLSPVANEELTLRQQRETAAYYGQPIRPTR